MGVALILGSFAILMLFAVRDAAWIQRNAVVRRTIFLAFIALIAFAIYASVSSGPSGCRSYARGPDIGDC